MSLTLSAGDLKVGGISAFSTSDYPGKFALVVFVQGCPWRCRYCHNPHLQARSADSKLSWSEIMALLKRRVGLIDAVVFSGGEATIDAALGLAIAEVRQLGFAIGLHSACIYPRQLQAILPSLDWIGFDIKAPFERYAAITGVADSGRHARACTEMILASGVDYECRSTIHPSLLSEHEIMEMAQNLSQMGVQNYVLQLFRAQGCNDAELKANMHADYPSRSLLQSMQSMFARFSLRQNN
jgi:pyruvate formate lyase activating enzyme